jgi:hypothetical protein
MKQKIAGETTARVEEVEVYPPAPSLDEAIVDEHSWLTLIERACSDRQDFALSLAHRLYDLKEAIESGPEGVRLAARALDEGIRTAYRYTNIHQDSLRHFYLYLAGELIGDHPRELL